ncbi:phosphate acyltransferase PlsX [candidate division KSB1 bacterium]|nr:phosphate acyltransferase PlsX [candidate division KSB1 bacterium]NIR71852.1 phosphate acyltransferase PlsX [candidate division KSB1 bacterium]NIS25368.1 phosphate acyltransferase PlsX [candidate division KSB1 bacterium]NIT71838.1 phosphate acyltransferase PlsX [candidate division KSB1 bacterium]NIU25576.1 phosphate acyltransferase PlsX [candidate division KSB1 bacterium]
MRIAVDAMGGDYAPEAIIHGGVEAARFGKGEYEVVFVGDESIIKTHLFRHFRIQELPVQTHHAANKIEMGESPTAAVKRKPDASINVAMALHKQGKVDGVVSAGHTGAAMASAFLNLGRIEHVKRPAIGSLIPHGQGTSLLIDVGANLECRPDHLLQFGVMGNIYIKNVYDLASPRVGLLNIGEEETKGDDVVRQAYQLLSQSDLNFVGNVEGRDVMSGLVDVIVCNGFVGNIVLKFAESFNGVYSKTLKRKIGKKVFSNIGAFLLKPTFERLRRIYDYEEYGGAPLLGINGTCVVCHGSSTPKAIKHAVIEAAMMIKRNVNQKIRNELTGMMEEERHAE